MNAKILPIPEIQKLLPQSADAEMGFLSSFLIQPDGVGAICAERRMTGAHFSIPAHQILFDALCHHWTEGLPIDFITLTQFLRDRGSLDDTGGAAFITGLFTFIPTAANATYYAEILEDKRILRELVIVGREFSARAMEDMDEAHALAEEAAARVCAIASHTVAAKPKTPREMIMDAMARADERIEKRGEVDFTMRTGIAGLDQGMSGIRLGDYVLISGKEKSGKTSLAFNILEHVVFAQQKRALAISLEMKLPEITDRMISSVGRVDFTDVLNGWMTEEEASRFADAGTKIAGGKFQVRDDLQSLPQIVAVFRQFKAGHPDFELGLVDYLQLIDADKGGRDDSREQVISHISRTMRRLASELNIAILMLVQLNEDGQVRESRAPGMDCTAHIRIEPGKEEGRKWARIVYQRNGPSNVGVPLAHLGPYLRFEQCASEAECDQAPERPFREDPRKKKWVE